MAGCRSTLSMSKIKVKISETKYRSFYKTLILSNQGMEKAVELKKNSTNTNREMAIIVTFIDLITHKNLHKLDVADISKILRTNIYDQLNRFVGLR